MSKIVYNTDDITNPILLGLRATYIDCGWLCRPAATISNPHAEERSTLEKLARVLRISGPVSSTLISGQRGGDAVPRYRTYRKGMPPSRVRWVPLFLVSLIPPRCPVMLILRYNLTVPTVYTTSTRALAGTPPREAKRQMTKWRVIDHPLRDCLICLNRWNSVYDKSWRIFSVFLVVLALDFSLIFADHTR